MPTNKAPLRLIIFPKNLEWLLCIILNQKFMKKKDFPNKILLPGPEKLLTYLCLLLPPPWGCVIIS